MYSKDQRAMDRAINIARLHKEKTQSSGSYFHGSVITKGGKIIGEGHNTMEPVNTSLCVGSLKHAELSAIENSLNIRKNNYSVVRSATFRRNFKNGKNYKSPLQGSTIYVVRIKKNGATAMSRPCNHCLFTLKKMGINRIFYSTGDIYNGEFVTCKVKEMENSYTTHSNRC